MNRLHNVPQVSRQPSSAFAICRGSGRSSARAGTPLRGITQPSVPSMRSPTTAPAGAIPTPASLPCPITSGFSLFRSHLHPQPEPRQPLGIGQLNSSNSISPKDGQRPKSIAQDMCSRRFTASQTPALETDIGPQRETGPKAKWLAKFRKREKKSGK